MPVPSRGHRVSSPRRVVPRLMLASLVCLMGLAGSMEAQGRGGGRGGRRGEPAGGGFTTSPTDRIKQQAEANDPLVFLLDHRKDLALTDAQRDTFKEYEKALKKERDGLMKEVRKNMPRAQASEFNQPPAMPDTVRALIGAMDDASTAWERRAAAHLDASQLAKSDTLRTEWLAKQRSARRRTRP